MDGCFEAKIVGKLGFNRGGLEEIRKRPKPVYATTKQKKEEMQGFKEYFKMKRDLQEGSLDRKALGTYEDIHAFLVITKKRRLEKQEEREFLRQFEAYTNDSQKSDSEAESDIKPSEGTSFMSSDEDPEVIVEQQIRFKTLSTLKSEQSQSS